MSITHFVRTSPFVRHNVVFFAGSLGVAALNYLYYPVLGRLLTPADFGEVQTLTSLFLQATIFLSILVYVAIHVTVNAKTAAERTSTLLALEHIALIAGVIILDILLLLTGVLKDFLHFSSSWPFVALIVALGLSIPLNLRMAFLRGRQQYLKSSLTDGAGSASKLVLSPLFVVVGLKSFGALIGLALSQGVSLALGIVWAYRAGLKGFGLRRRNLNTAVLRPQLRYACSVFLVTGSITAMTSLDMLAVKHYFTPEQAGVYAGMTTVARIVFFLTAPFTGVLLTMVSLRQPAHKNALWLKGTLALTLGVGGSALAIITLFSDLTIKILVGHKYLTYADLLPKLCLALFLLGVANTILMYYIALRRYAYSLIPVAVTFFTLILLYVRHNAVTQVVDNMLAGSSALLFMALLVHLYTNMIVRIRKGIWKQKGNSSPS